MSRRLRVFALVPLIALGGCLMAMPRQSGRTIDTEFVKLIEKGKTTMEDVQASLGRPASVSHNGEIQEWTYMHWEGKPAMFGESYSKSKTQLLRIQFRDGKVVNYSLSTSER